MIRIYIRILILACLSWVPALAAAFDLHGYKSIEFGMTPQQVTKLGFECMAAGSNSYGCSKTELDKNPETLFGKPVTVLVLLYDGKVRSIDVSTHMSTRELVSLYEKSLGDPKVQEYQASGGRMRRYFWVSNQKTSIWIAEPMYSVSVNTITQNNASATYSDIKATAEFLSLGDHSTDLKDF